MIIPLANGLELTQDKLRTPPGTLQDCLNYEIAYSSGYRRIDGFLRYDGRAELADLAAYRQLVQKVPGGPAYGVHFFPDWFRDESIVYAVVESTRYALSSRGNFDPALLGEVGQRAEIYTGSKSGTPNAWVLEPASNFIDSDGNDYIEMIVEGSISSGDIVAYSRLEIQDGQNEPSAGDQVQGASWTGTVRGVTVFSGAGVDNTLWMEVWVETDSGSEPDIGEEITLVSNSDRIGDVVDFSGWSENGTSVGTIGSVASGLAATLNDGVILRTTSRGWEPIEPAYEARFVSGAIEPTSIYLSSSSQSPAAEGEYIGGTASSEVDNRASSPGWFAETQRPWTASSGTLGDAVQDDDGTYAQATLEGNLERTELLNVSRFDGRRGIYVDPLSEVTGFVVEVVAEQTGTAPVEVRQVLASTGGARGGGTEIGTKATHTFGSSVDLWGANSSEDLAEALGSGSFTISVVLGSEGSSDFPVDVRVHSVKLILYLRGSDVDASVFVRSGGTDYSARVLHFDLQDGDWGSGDAEGILTLARIDNPSLIASGAQVRTAADGGGSLIATLDSQVEPIRLPSKNRMDDRQSKFQFINTNFFAAGKLTAVYGVSGAGPAFTFNEQYLFRIRTGRTEDEPRHVARHADRLALGYENGDADFSVSGRPDSYDGALDAFSLGFGQRITGMLPLTGGALGVWTEDSTHIVKGSVASQVQQQIVSPTSGAIEYTVADMGVPVYCDYRGISTLVASQRFGDFDMGRLSESVRAWLVPRLSSLRSDGDQRPILAQPVQQKNQYRMFFADGEIMTMTFINGEEAKFTFQRWEIPDVGVAKVISATNGLDRELANAAFASFEGSDYVYRLDHTDTFDGDDIEASFTTNPINVSTPGRYQRINIGHIHARVEGDTEVNTQLGVNYSDPAGYTATCTLKGTGQAFTKFRHKARGRDFAIKVSTTGAPIHTIQELEFPDISQRTLER